MAAFAASVANDGALESLGRQRKVRIAREVAGQEFGRADDDARTASPGSSNARATASACSSSSFAAASSLLIT